MGERFVEFYRQNPFFLATTLEDCNYFASMSVQEDVLRIKKSIEKMMQNKSVVKLHKFVRRFRSSHRLPVNSTHGQLVTGGGGQRRYYAPQYLEKVITN